MNRKKVVIVSRSFAKATQEPLKLLERNEIEYEFRRNNEPENIEGIIEKIGDAEAIILGNDTLNVQIMEQCPNLRFVSKQGVGVDRIDLSGAQEHNIKVVCTPNANTEAVADLTLTFILNIQRNFKNNVITSDTPDWASKEMAHDLFGACVGIVGFGRIGQAVARRLAGFQTELLVYETNPVSSMTEFPNMRFVSLDELLRKADIVTLHVPLLETTQNLIDEAALRKMKKDAVLINASRGGLVDEKALYNRLKNGELRGVGLDVFAVEPPVKYELLTLNNVVATPHIAPYTVETNLRMGMQAAQNIVDYFAGKEA